MDAQPSGARDRLREILSGDTLPMAILVHFDFANNPVRLSNRNLPFTDLQGGHVWGAGSHLLVSMPNASGGTSMSNPALRYRIAFPEDQIENFDYAAYLVGVVQDRANYVGRTQARYGQIFDPDTGHPVGYPFALDVGRMDRMSVSFMPRGAIVSMQVEGYLTDMGRAVYGTLTYRDQKRRFPTDEGCEFVTESGNLVVWTQW
jgi:hypothetical protein